MRSFRYAALGDSTSVGVGAGEDGGFPVRVARRIKEGGVSVGLLNLGLSGATSADVLAEQVDLVVARPPELISLGIGTNDLWRMVPVAAFETNIERIADRLERTGAPVLVSNLIDLMLAPAGKMVEQLLGISPRALGERLATMNARLAGLARRPRFTLVDLFGFSERELPAHPEYFSSDGFHPSALGYDRWADLVFRAAEPHVRRWRP
jgi:lysophospholipase L1-like esterase